MIAIDIDHIQIFFFKRTLDDGWWLYSLHTQQFNRNNSCKKVPLFSIFHLENVKNVIIWFQWGKKACPFPAFIKETNKWLSLKRKEKTIVHFLDNLECRQLSSEFYP